jgi:hypothetical protein
MFAHARDTVDRVETRHALRSFDDDTRVEISWCTFAGIQNPLHELTSDANVHQAILVCVTHWTQHQRFRLQLRAISIRLRHAARLRRGCADRALASRKKGIVCLGSVTLSKLRLVMPVIRTAESKKLACKV